MIHDIPLSCASPTVPEPLSDDMQFWAINVCKGPIVGVLKSEVLGPIGATNSHPEKLAMMAVAPNHEVSRLEPRDKQVLCPIGRTHFFACLSKKSTKKARHQTALFSGLGDP